MASTNPLSRLPRVGSRLPMLRLATAPSGAPVDLRRWGREATVLVWIDDSSCERCRAYVQELDRHREDFAAWDGRVIVVVPAPLEEAARLKRDLDLHLIVAGDPEHRSPLAGAEGPALLVADRYGDVYYVTEADARHALPGPRELEEWLKFLATQCPE